VNRHAFSLFISQGRSRPGETDDSGKSSARPSNLRAKHHTALLPDARTPSK
jgi:hypothetical protein